jgi:hypothetical protein
VLKARVFALSVLTNDAKVDIVVTGLVTRNILDENNGGENVEFLTESNIEGLVARALNGGEKNTLQTELVSSQGSDRFFKELLRVLVSGVNTANIHLFPLNGHIIGLEDSLNRLGDFSTNTITCFGTG